MNPTPAMLMHSEIFSGLVSSFTPSAINTSADPDLDDKARLPCLATFNPAPAATNAAQVEILNEPDESPPVPTMSMASAGASTRSIFSRMTVTAPTSSSTVSPRTRSAMRNAPICDGVASPDIRIWNAVMASSCDRLRPSATFANSGLRLFIVSHLQDPESSSISHGRFRMLCFPGETAHHAHSLFYVAAP